MATTVGGKHSAPHRRAPHRRRSGCPARPWPRRAWRRGAAGSPTTGAPRWRGRRATRSPSRRPGPRPLRPPARRTTSARPHQIRPPTPCRSEATRPRPTLRSCAGRELGVQTHDNLDQDRSQREGEQAGPGGGALVAALLLASAGCSGDDDSDDNGAPETDATTTTVDRPDGPVADLSEELTEGNGVFLGSPDAFAANGSYIVEVDEPGYVQEEFVASGAASSYVVDGELTAGRRMGARARPDRRLPHPCPRAPTGGSRGLQRRGDRRVAQRERRGRRRPRVHLVAGRDRPAGSRLRRRVGAATSASKGGPVLVEVDVPGADFAGLGVKAIDPERYGSLDASGRRVLLRHLHPGGPRAARGPGVRGPRAVRPRRVRPIPVGRGDGQLRQRGAAADPGLRRVLRAQPRRLRPALPSRRGDRRPHQHARRDRRAILRDRHRRADRRRAGRERPLRSARLRSPPVNPTATPSGCGRWPAPLTPIARSWAMPRRTSSTAGCRSTTRRCMSSSEPPCGTSSTWVVDGEPPPEAPRLEVTEGDAPTIRRDEDGIALGGVRTPPVDVPVEVLSGEQGPGNDTICLLSGSTSPMPPDASRSSTRRSRTTSGATAMPSTRPSTAGFVLEDDRAVIEAYAEPDLVGAVGLDPPPPTFVPRRALNSASATRPVVAAFRDVADRRDPRACAGAEARSPAPQERAHLIAGMEHRPSGG